MGWRLGERVPVRTLERFGMWTAPHSAVNEAGLRYLIGFAMREASAHNLLAMPVFSLFAPHGPVFRAMLQLSKVDQNTTPRPSDFLRMYAHCESCADGRLLPWADLGKPGRAEAAEVRSTQSQGQSILDRYTTRASSPACVHVVKFLSGLRQRNFLIPCWRKADPELPPYYFTTRDISKAVGTSPPPLRKVIDELKKRGFVAARSHVERNAIKTNASFRETMEAATKVNERKRVK